MKHLWLLVLLKFSWLYLNKLVEHNYLSSIPIILICIFNTLFVIQLVQNLNLRNIAECKYNSYSLYKTNKYLLPINKYVVAFVTLYYLSNIMTGQ